MNIAWSAILPLIAQIGVPAAQQIWAWAESGKVVTAEDWARLEAIKNVTPESTLATLAVAAGLPMDDPRIVAIATLIK